MQKIMFNDRYGLTSAVLAGTKTQTRRIANTDRLDMEYLSSSDEETRRIRSMSILTNDGRFSKGEVVAVAQRYADLKMDAFIGTPGWSNKMFVKAELMPRRIRISSLRLEKLQDISDEDCLKEGIYMFKHKTSTGTQSGYGFNHGGICCKTPKEAYSVLIDKVAGKGTWNRNPYVIVYDFTIEP